MNTLPVLFRRTLLSAICLGLAGPATAQSIADALDTSGREWVLEGSGQVVTGGELAHDGVDAMRLAGGDPGVAASVSTVITEPSVVTFHHRSESLNQPAAMVRCNRFLDRS